MQEVGPQAVGSLRVGGGDDLESGRQCLVQPGGEKGVFAESLHHCRQSQLLLSDQRVVPFEREAALGERLQDLFDAALRAGEALEVARQIVQLVTWRPQPEGPTRSLATGVRPRGVEPVDDLAQLSQIARQRGPGREQASLHLEAALEHVAAHGRGGGELALAEPIDGGDRPQVPLAAGIERGKRLDILGDGSLDLLSVSRIDDPGRVGPGGLRRVRSMYEVFHWRRRRAPSYSGLAASAAGFGAGAGLGAAAVGVLAAAVGARLGAADREPSPVESF